MTGVTAIVAGGLVARVGEAAALMTMAIIGIGALLVLDHVCADPSGDAVSQARLIRWTMGAFLAHLAVGLIVTHSNTLTNYLGPDAATYHHVALGIVKHWTAGTAMPDIVGGKEGFFYLLAGLYWVFGPFTVAGMALNAALAAALVPLVTDTTRRLYGAGAARYAAPLMLLLPGLFIWSSQLLKEAPVLFLIAVAANAGVRISDRITVGPIAAMVASIALLLAFRGPLGLVLGASILGGVVLGRRELVSGVASGIAILGLIVAFVVVAGVGQSGYQETLSTNLQKTSETRQNLARAANSGFGADIDTSTSSRAVVYLPIGLFNFTLGPFPWQGGALRQLAAMPDVLVWWWLLPVLWRGFRDARRRTGRRVLTVVLPAVTVWLLLALVISNFGIVIREREQVVVLVAPLLALGLAGRAQERAAVAAGEAVPSTA
jgi:4-amino-4-deoxy-L-arabinose transferase-like glycosyltransferase